MSQIYFIWSNTLHVSESLSIHHQGLKTVHTATGIYQTDTAKPVFPLVSSWQYLLYMFQTVFPSTIRSSRLYIQQHAYVEQPLPSAC